VKFDPFQRRAGLLQSAMAVKLRGSVHVRRWSHAQAISVNSHQPVSEPTATNAPVRARKREPLGKAIGY